MGCRGPVNHINLNSDKQYLNKCNHATIDFFLLCANASRPVLFVSKPLGGPCLP